MYTNGMLKFVFSISDYIEHNQMHKHLNMLDINDYH